MGIITKNQDGTFTKQLDNAEIKAELTVLRNKLVDLNRNIDVAVENKEMITKRLVEFRAEKQAIKDIILSITSLDTTLIDPIDQV